MNPGPAMPFIVQGIIKDLDGSTVLSGAEITIMNKTQMGATNVRTDANGQYVLDLANTGRDTSADDVISIKIVKGVKARVKEVTITSSMIDDGMTVQNLTIYGLRQHTFDIMFTLYNDNLPPNFTDNDGSTSVSWSLTASFPESEPVFPVIIIDPARVNETFPTMGSSTTEDSIVVETMFYGRARNGKGQLDKARDFMRDVLITNEDDLNYAGLYFKEDFLDDSNIDELLFADEKYNLGNQILNFWWSP